MSIKTPNIITTNGEITEIKTWTKKWGENIFLIDTTDRARVATFHWTPVRINGRIYAKTGMRDGQGVYHNIFLHRLITSFSMAIVDHRDNDPKNNCSANLREATHTENMRNSKTQKNNKLGIKGVRWRPRHKQYEASIWHQGKSRFIGLYRDTESASRAYREAARERFGEFARGAS